MYPQSYQDRTENTNAPLSTTAVTSPTVLSRVVFWAIPLASVAVSVSLILFQLLPAFRTILATQTENARLEKSAGDLRSGIAASKSFYDQNSQQINLGLELLKSVVPSESGKLSISQSEIESLVQKNSLKLTSFRTSENLRDILNESIADGLVGKESKHRVAVSEVSLEGSFDSMQKFLQDSYKSGNLTVMESFSLVKISSEKWLFRGILAKYWFFEDFLKSRTKESLIKSATNELDFRLLEKLKSKVR